MREAGTVACINNVTSDNLIAAAAGLKLTTPTLPPDPRTRLDTCSPVQHPPPPAGPPSTTLECSVKQQAKLVVTRTLGLHWVGWWVGERTLG